MMPWALFALAVSATVTPRFDTGVASFRANDCATALAEFDASDKAGEKAPELPVYRGICLAKTGEWERAADLLRAWTASHPDEARGWYWLAQAELYRKRFTEARDAIIHAIVNDQSSANAYRTLGQIELELKSYDEAYRAWIKANKLNPRDARTTYYLGRLFFEAEFLDEAAVWLRRTLALDPHHFAAMTYLAMCAERLNMQDTATQLYITAIRESKEQRTPFAWAFLNYGKLLRQNGRDQEALAIFEEGEKLCPEAHLLTALGQMLASADHTERAVQVLRRATEMDPSIPDAHYRLALLYRLSGRTDEAQVETRRFQETKAAEERDKVKIQAVRK
jgi:tetratricopeptide (TPR) repeat protein